MSIRQFFTVRRIMIVTVAAALAAGLSFAQQSRRATEIKSENGSESKVEVKREGEQVKTSEQKTEDQSQDGSVNITESVTSTEVHDDSSSVEVRNSTRQTKSTGDVTVDGEGSAVSGSSSNSDSSSTSITVDGGNTTVNVDD